jgi:hypothetical protein
MLQVESYYKESSFIGRSFTVGYSCSTSVIRYISCKINEFIPLILIK